MIADFKLFKSINEGEPEIGDWVLCGEESSDDEISIFVLNNVGQYIKNDNNSYYPYVIYYYNVPKNLYDFFRNNERNMKLSEIQYCSKNKEYLEQIIKTRKFNL